MKEHDRQRIIEEARRKLRAEILTLTDEQAEYVLRRLKCLSQNEKSMLYVAKTSG